MPITLRSKCTKVDGFSPSVSFTILNLCRAQWRHDGQRFSSHNIVALLLVLGDSIVITTYIRFIGDIMSAMATVGSSTVLTRPRSKRTISGSKSVPDFVPFVSSEATVFQGGEVRDHRVLALWKQTSQWLSSPQPELQHSDTYHVALEDLSTALSKLVDHRAT